MKRIFYEKVGRRYVPVSEYDSDLLDAYPKGSHLVICYPGGRSTRFNVDPALAPMIAAGRYAEEEIAAALVKASSMRPGKPLTEEQHKIWQILCKSFGNDLYSVQWDSARDIAEAGVAAMQQEADKLLKNAAVRQAYEEFMLLCELAKEHEEEQ